MPLPAAKTDDDEFNLLIKWLKSYKPDELFHPDNENIIDDTIKRIVPKNPKHRLGQVKATYAGFTELKTPDWKPFATEKGKEMSNMKA